MYVLLENKNLYLLTFEPDGVQNSIQLNDYAVLKSNVHDIVKD